MTFITRQQGTIVPDGASSPRNEINMEPDCTLSYRIIKATRLNQLQQIVLYHPGKK
jgi:hypothetical protein